MIIVKQNRRGIVNLDNTIEIFADKEDDGCPIFFVPCNIEGLDVLGEYATESRAEEVLKEITERYEQEGPYKGLIYEMPED